MSLNRYRLRHLARQKNRAAQITQNLLKRPDRLLGIILIGNTFANILASSLFTIMTLRVFGDVGIAFSSIILTLFILIFAEVIPKTFAAIHAERVAFFAARPLSILLTLGYPVVWIANAFSNAILRLIGIEVNALKTESLTTEELRTVVTESTSQMARRHQSMLLGVLDLEKATVADVMIPRSQIYAINLADPWPAIFKKMQSSPFAKIPVYQDHLDNLVGVLYLKRAISLINDKEPNLKKLRRLISPVSFVPETASLQKQLVQFQKQGEHFGVVIDEYGDIQGLVTVEDILEEIVGELTMDQQSLQSNFHRQKNGAYVINGSMTIRDINRHLQLDLPQDGAKTLSGLITEYLQDIPVPKTSVLIAQYPIEIMSVKDNAVAKARVLPRILNTMMT